MKTRWLIGPLCLTLAGCVSAPVLVEEDSPVMEPPRPSVLFPDYLLIDGFELNDHGRISGTGLVGADMTVVQDVGTVRSLISEQLSAHEWTTDKMEIGRQHFRVLASHAGEEVEIRAVQGTGPTQVFILYRPTAFQEKK